MFSSIFSEIIFLALHLEKSNLFPPPLDMKQEKELLEKAEKGDKAAREKIIRHNLRLVAHITKKYYTANEDTDELISVGTVGLIKAVNSFNHSKGTRLATYAARCIENEILMHFRNQKKTSLDVSFEEPIETDNEGNPLTLMDIIAKEDTVLDEIDLKSNILKLRKYINELDDKRERDIIILRYGLNGEKPKTQNQIAEKYDISRSYVSRIETKTLKKLRKKFENDDNELL